MKRKIIKEISPSDKTIFIGIDAFSKEAWKEINKKINRDQPTIIFGEGFFQYTSKKQRRLLAKKILPILNNGCLFFEDSIRYHPEFVLNRKIESGIKKVVKQSKSSNYLEKLSQKELTQELKSYGFNVKRISPIFIRTKNPFFKNFRTWVLTRKCNSAN
jgi:O-methyltransferase involved in polyketide biosynthesis